MIHKILLSIGIALGIITVGATANAKADQLNANNTADNTPQTDQNLNNDQMPSSNDTLVNQSNYYPVMGTESTPSSESTNYDSNSMSNSNAEPNYSTYNSRFVPSNSTNSTRYSKYTSHSSSDRVYGNNYRNYRNHRYNSRSKAHFHNRLGHVYRNILSRQSHHGSRFHHHRHNYYHRQRRHYHHRQYHMTFNKRTRRTRSKRHVRTYHGSHVAHLGARNARNTRYRSMKIHHHHHNWFRDGLNHRNLSARNWISWHESNHRWNVLSYGGVCVGYFQLNPHYLGYRHGHVDLRPKHQVKVADRYVRGRYGNWANAKRFWVMHHWY